MDRTTRQSLSIDKWRNNKGIGTIEGCTGYGKTRCATEILLKLQEAGKSGSIVVVPTLVLQEQWREIIEERDINDCEVWVINSLIIQPFELDTKTLVLDEIHMYAADTFYQVFDKVSYKFILGLTGTLERLDGKHILLEKYCPVIDTIPYAEAEKNGWVAEALEYNLYIQMNEEEKQQYNKINNIIGSLFSTFNHDYNLMRSCTIKKSYYDGNRMVNGADAFIRNNPELVLYDSFENKLVGENLLSEVVKQANICLGAIKNREDFIHNRPSKGSAAIKIIQHLNKKTVTFGKSTDMADNINENLNKLGIKSAVYHSKIEGEDRLERKIKKYIGKQAALNFKKKTGGTIEPTDDGYNVIYSKKVRYGSKRIKKEVIDKLGKDELLVVNSIKALVLGLDVRGMEVAVIYSADGNPSSHEQKRGRVGRKEGGKVGITVNIILQGTQDEVWARRRQVKNARRVRHINDISEIKV